MNKKRKNNEDTSEAETSKKRIKYKHTGTESSANISAEESSSYRVFLIKKPISVTLDDLNALKWSSDAEVLAKTKVKTGSGVFRAVVASRDKKERMVHLPAIREQEESDSKNIKAQNFVDGSITILPQETKQELLGGFIYEEGDEPLDNTVLIHPSLRKIKKTAVLELNSRKQRNSAYGTSTDGSGKPRELSNLLKQ